MYGNPMGAGNKKHRFVILWKDGIQRLLPTTASTEIAEYSFSATDEPGGHLPGFWTSEHSTTRASFYHGMLHNLYSAYTSHTLQDPQLRTTKDLRGIKPSSRWYLYSAHTPTHETNDSSSSSHVPRRGSPLQTTQKAGRGHGSHPPINVWKPSATPVSTATPTTDSSTDLTTPQFMRAMMMGMQNLNTQISALSTQSQSQSQINTDVAGNLTRINAFLATLQSNTPPK